jgi:hypothetical protein
MLNPAVRRLTTIVVLAAAIVAALVYISSATAAAAATAQRPHAVCRHTCSVSTSYVPAGGSYRPSR